MVGVLSLILLANISVACAQGGLDLGLKARITLQNHSQFQLNDLRLHDGDPVRYNRIPGIPLAVDAELEFELDRQRYLTVVREKTRGGPQIALSTEAPLPVYRGLYSLEIFDDAFRLHDEGPLPEDKFIGDGGDGDAGSADAGPPDAGP